MPLFGAHMSVAGGLHLAFDHIRSVNGEALQIFTRNQRQWRAHALSQEEIELFKNAWAQAGQMPVASHNSYLINLANPKNEAAEKSINALIDELERCAALGIPYVVMHPGSHLGQGTEEGIRRFTSNLNQVFTKARAEEVVILLENTAGQGSNLGSSFSELGAMIRQSHFSERLGICFDTCHAFAAGYDIGSEKGYSQSFAEFEEQIGIKLLKFFHLNDSKGELGSRLDRHTHIGEGKIGLNGFQLLVNDSRFSRHPMILETPKGKDLAEDKQNLSALRRLIKKP